MRRTMRTSRRQGFDQYLRNQRVRRRLAVDELALASRMSVARLLALESGSATPEPKELSRLARALEVPPETMFAKAGQWRHAVDQGWSP